MLKFGTGNAKLHKGVAHVSLLSGWSCPNAKECSSRVRKDGDKRFISDGPDTKFRCFSASQEALYTNVYESRKHNFDELKGKNKEQMAAIIEDSLPKQDIIRIHVAGDFFNQAYFDAWCEVSRNNPAKLFYAYTKSLPYWVDAKKRGIIPKNLVLTASYGGTHDHLIKKHRLRYVKVVFSEKEAADMNLPIDHDDSHAMNPRGNFALLIHGIQPPNSEAGHAVRDLKGVGSYGRDRK